MQPAFGQHVDQGVRTGFRKNENARVCGMPGTSGGDGSGILPSGRPACGSVVVLVVKIGQHLAQGIGEAHDPASDIFAEDVKVGQGMQDELLVQ